MTSLLKTTALALTALFALAGTAQAAPVTIGFDDLAPTGAITSYTEDGFELTSPSGGGNHFNGNGFGNPGPAVFPGATTTEFTLAHSGGAPFNALSIDIIRLTGTVDQIQFTGTLAAGGTVVQDFFTTVSGYQTYVFNSSFSALSSLFWTGVPSATVFYDNIVVDTAVALPLPLPGAALLLGFGLIGLSVRRRTM